MLYYDNLALYFAISVITPDISSLYYVIYTELYYK